MFSHNQKISSRQMKSLLILDWLAKLCLLLPFCLAGRSLGTMVGCLAAGLLLWIWFAGLIVPMADDHQDFFDLLTERIGSIGAWSVYLVGFFYFLSHTAVCINLCASLAGVYLLPETALPVLALLPLATGLYLACSTMEVQGRMGELTVPVLLGLFLFMTAFDAAGMDLISGEEHLLQPDERLASGSYEVFACMGGMFLPVLFPYLSEKKNPAALIRKSACLSLIPAGILLFITAGSFGIEGMFAFDFPTVRVMSNVTVPGGFLQRWDVFFLMLLLFSLAFSVGSSLWYLNEMTGRLWEAAAGIRLEFDPEPGRRQWRGGDTVAGVWQEEYSGELTEFENDQREADETQTEKPGSGLWVLRGIAVFVIFCGAVGFRNPAAAVNYYRAFNLYILTPFMILVYFVMYFRGRLKNGKKAAILFTVLCMLLTGCTARELEDRIFPMVLELRIEEDELVMTYAWNGEEAPGSGGGGKGEEETKTGSEDVKNKKNENESELKTEKEEDNTGDFSLRKEPVEHGNLTIFRGSTLGQIQQQVEEYSDRYMDYSHVKAIILDEKLEEYPKLQRDVYEWLAGEPAFAASLILYPAQESGLSLIQVDERSDGKIGDYLENLYENNWKLQEIAVTLGRKTAEIFG